MMDEKLVRAIVSIFYWHPTVQEYFVQGIILGLDEKRSIIENWKIGLRYMQEHGDSIWAKIDYVAGKVRVILFVAVVIFMIALLVGWRPHL